MRRWGVVISGVYAVMLLAFLVPLGVLFADERGLLTWGYYQDVWETYSEWAVWVPVAMLIVGQVALLFVSVDTSERRLKPRGSVMRSAVIASMLLMMITVALVGCVGVAIFGDKLGDRLSFLGYWLIGIWAGIWAVWGMVFYLYLRGKTEITTRVVSWLLRGSILELLIAVPCHVIVRRRDDCCAPIVTSFGITSGLAIMLLSFGPSVLLLYKKRIEERQTVRQREVNVH